ncbi:MAG: PQQ-binding-like beta-propeller repeat protein, partial [Butyricicoccus sp.]|nr:PQQ-binding-like beta-propeller repeat protein [Butyricicoccus sp.]
MIVLSVILMVLLAAAVAVNLYAAGQTRIFWQTGYDDDIQNSRILVDEELGITFLGAYNNSVRAYDSDGNSIWTAEIGGAVESMAYDSERDWLIVGSQDRNIYIYAAADGANVNTYTLKGRVYDLDYDQAGGRLLVSSGVSKTKHELLVLDVATGEELNKVSMKKVSRAAKFTPDKQHIVYGTNQGRVILCDLEGEKIAEQKVSGEMRSLAVVEATGEVVTMDKAGYLHKFDKDLNELYDIDLLGEGRCVSASAAGKWIAAGTREGDIHILNSEGVSQFSTRQENDVSQIYFGEEQSYVVTLSADLYGFDAERLENIGLMDTL